MSDLISRQAAIEATCYNCTEKEICNGICDDTNRLRELPTIDPVKHGKWIDDMGVDEWPGRGIYGRGSVWHRRCSLCGYEREDDNSDKDTLFCPNCGSKMGGGEG